MDTCYKSQHNFINIKICVYIFACIYTCKMPTSTHHTCACIFKLVIWALLTIYNFVYISLRILHSCVHGNRISCKFVIFLIMSAFEFIVPLNWSAYYISRMPQHINPCGKLIWKCTQELCISLYLPFWVQFRALNLE